MTDQNLLLQEGGYPNAPDIKTRLSRNVSVMHFRSKEALYEDVDATRLAALTHIEQMERSIVEYQEQINNLEDQFAKLIRAAIQAEKAINILWVPHHANTADAALKAIRDAIPACQGAIDAAMKDKP